MSVGIYVHLLPCVLLWLQFHHTILLGDLNFGLKGITRQEVLRNVTEACRGDVDTWRNYSHCYRHSRMKKGYREDFYCSRYRWTFDLEFAKLASEKKSKSTEKKNREEQEDEEEDYEEDLQDEEEELDEEEEEEETIRRWYWMTDVDELQLAMAKGEILSGEQIREGNAVVA